MSSGYKIGTTALNMVDVETVIDSWGSMFYPRSENIDYPVQHQLGSGGARFAGNPYTAWNWDFLPVTDYYALLTAYCAGASAEVYITTRKNGNTFAVFTATMVRPEKEPERYTSTRLKEIRIEFRNLVEQAEP